MWTIRNAYLCCEFEFHKEIMEKALRCEVRGLCNKKTGSLRLPVQKGNHLIQNHCIVYGSSESKKFIHCKNRYSKLAGLKDFVGICIFVLYDQVGRFLGHSARNLASLTEDECFQFRITDA